LEAFEFLDTENEVARLNPHSSWAAASFNPIVCGIPPCSSPDTILIVGCRRISEMDAAIIGIGGAILGALTGAWITYWFLIKIDKRQVRQWDVVPLIPFLI
jgi:hypothetical protein